MLRLIKYVIIGSVAASFFAYGDKNNLSVETLAQASEAAKDMFNVQIDTIEKAESIAGQQQFSRDLAEASKQLENISVPTNGTGFNMPEKYYKDYKPDNIFNTIKDNNKKYSVSLNDGVNKPIVMVSFSMPDITIKRLMDDMDKVGGAVVFNGLVNNDMKQTLKAIQDLGGKDGGALVDPTYFERFKVNQVPTFIIPKEGIKPCSDNNTCDVPKHIKVAGDVSFNYILDMLERVGTEEDKLIAKQLQKHLN